MYKLNNYLELISTTLELGGGVHPNAIKPIPTKVEVEKLINSTNYEQLEVSCRLFTLKLKIGIETIILETPTIKIPFHMDLGLLY